LENVEDSLVHVEIFFGGKGKSALLARSVIASQAGLEALFYGLEGYLKAAGDSSNAF